MQSKTVDVAAMLVLAFLGWGIPAHAEANGERERLAGQIETAVIENSAVFGYIRAVQAKLTSCTLRVTVSYTHSCERSDWSSRPIAISKDVALNELTADPSHVRVTKFKDHPDTVMLYWPLNRLAEEKRLSLSDLFRQAASKFRDQGINGIERLKEIAEHVEPQYEEIGLRTRSYLHYCDRQPILQTPIMVNTHLFEEGGAEEFNQLVSGYREKYCRSPGTGTRR